MLMEIHDALYAKMGQALYYAIAFVAAIGILAQYRLYEKAGQPGLAAVVPIWNVVVFMRIVGRPDRHAWLMLVPIYGQLYFIPKVWIEVVQSFGKRSMVDYVLVILLNGLYILNLAMSYETEYEGPVYGKPKPASSGKTNAQPSLA